VSFRFQAHSIILSDHVCITSIPSLRPLDVMSHRSDTTSHAFLPPISSSHTNPVFCNTLESILACGLESSNCFTLSHHAFNSHMSFCHVSLCAKFLAKFTTSFSRSSGAIVFKLLINVSQIISHPALAVDIPANTNLSNADPPVSSTILLNSFTRSILSSHDCNTLPKSP
tara:strand:- start:1868 stop:2377 length:510 start_codon:yes stop_codon:yes gene_type:complete